MVVRSKHRGVSLMSALLLVTIVVTIAAVMAGVFTLNINITNRVSNGSVALSEAEAGISEVLYQITQDENIEGDGNQENPKILFGLNGETILATTTPGLEADEAYHVVTFDQGSSFPYSTNNTTLTNDTGYNGRVVPDGMLHVISTGYCKGQYRTIECVIEKPPFPFGLATSGKVDSVDPIRVLGTSSQAAYAAGETDRPGHILCNSPEGVVIGEAESGEDGTFISGFVKSVGPVSIAQPAVVRGGIRSNAEATTLTDIKIQDFNLDSQGADGVITLLDDDYYEDQELDVMYKYLKGGNLHYHGKVNLQQAMLWIDGNLEIEGPVTGEGLIVVNGTATIHKGADLNGTDKMALLAAGDIKLGQDGGVPAANHFSGLVYTEGNLDAKNITVVGNAVANSPDPDKGQATLENVTLVSNEETGDMTVTINTVSGAEDGYAAGADVIAGDFNFGNFDGDDIPGGDGPFIISADVSDEDLDWIYEHQFRGSLFGESGALGDSTIPPVMPELSTSDPYGFVGQFEELVGAIQTAQTEIQANNVTIGQLQSELSGLKPDSDPNDDDDEDQARIDEINDELSTLNNENDTLQADAEALYESKARQLLEDVRAQARKNANKKGTVKTATREGQTIIPHDERFNLNEYLPQSDRVKMSFWKVYPRRM